ncbi:unnamed protein product [Sympodiomycopsis kandeliae]
MFDDFVRDSNSRETAYQYGASATAGPSASGGYQTDGFEPDEYGAGVTSLETGFNSAEDANAALTPIFQLGRVQYVFPAPLALLTVSSNILTMCLYDNPQGGVLPSNLPPPPRLVRINLDQPEKTEEAEIPLAPTPRNRNALTPDSSQIGPHKMFADPSGRHLILAMRNGENFYWCSGWKKARLLSKWKGVRVESIAWKLDGSSQALSSKRHSSSNFLSTGEILVGTSSGDIYEAVISAPLGTDASEGDFLDRLARRTAGANSPTSDVDRVFRHLFTLSERQAISGLLAVPFSTTGAKRNAGVIATTSTRIFEFVGPVGKERRDDNDSQSFYAKLFEPYKGTVPNLKSELPGEAPSSELRIWLPASGRTPKALTWLTGPGVYHGLLSYVNQDVGESVIDSANLLPYPTFVDEDRLSGTPGTNTAAPQTPLSIMLTEFHFILLYSNRVMGISTLDDRVAFEEELPLKPHERVIGSCVDSARQTYWIYTDASIFELVVKDEDRDVWKVYLERGAHDSALKHVRNSNQRDVVLSAKGDRFFKETRYIQAAQSYAQSFTRTFEEVVLRFLDVDARDALRYYLVARLERLRKVDTTQRTMLATWLVEIYLSKLDELEDIAAANAASQDVENYGIELGIFDEELKQFFVTYKDDLDQNTTFTLISRHGRSDMLIHYAGVVHQYDRIVRHWIDVQDWQNALKVLDQQPNLNLYYRFAATLIRNDPVATVDSWIKRPDLDDCKLIPAMLQHKPAKGEANQAVRYLDHVIRQQNVTTPAVHNFLFATLARGSEGESEEDINNALLDFIASSPTDPLTGSPYYDLDYALRTCEENGRKEASVRIFAKMGFYEDAVDLALDNRDVDLACYCADLIETDEALRRRLWLKAAKYVVDTEQNITTAMEFLSLTPLLSIEDILPFFPDFTVIDSFKEEICLALESYATKIEDLKSEMERATGSAEHIREDINKLSQRFVTVDPEEKCGACQTDALQRQFYVFPCRHVFHADCLIAETTRRLPPRTLRRLLDLQGQLSRATSGLIPNVPASVTTAVSGARSSEPITMGNLGHVLTNRAGATAAAAVSGVGLDRLPETLISVLSAGVSVSVAGGKRVLAPLDPFTEPTITYIPRNTSNGESKGDASEKQRGPGNQSTAIIDSRRSREEMEEVDRLREEMDAIIAGNCPLCEGSLADLGKSFLGSSRPTATLSVGKGNIRHSNPAAVINAEEDWSL